MKKKTKIILTLAGVALSCAGLAACTSETKLDILAKEGNIVSVVYDSNGGRFNSSSGMSVVNMFNPDNFKDSDGDGKIEIPLKSTDPMLYSSIGAPTKNGYFFAGWFETRELATKNGVPVSDYGDVLELGEDGLYYIQGTKTRANQAYNYSNMWDVATDKVLYTPESGAYKLTLYAAWVPNYRFDYYYQKDGSTDWSVFNNTSFDYSTTQKFKDTYAYSAAAKETVDNEMIWVPKWSGENDTGAMVYAHSYSNNTTYNFPKMEGFTFSSAYSDSACQNPIADGLQHGGSLIYNQESKKLEIHDLIQNVYVKLDKGEQYRITTADEFITYAASSNASSVYTILNSELDFDGKTWPAALSGGEFKGKIVGNNSTFKNISATNNDESITFGGLFGQLAETSEISNIMFDNVVYDIATGCNDPHDDVVAYYGVFAGFIDSDAKVNGITVKNSTLKMGKLSRCAYSINLACGSGKENISYSNIIVVLTGVLRNGKYEYYVTELNVNEETGAVIPKIEIASSRADVRDEESYTAYPVAENN